VTARPFAAIDLGASSGRVIVGRVGPDTIDLDEVHRFPNGPVERADGLHWDIEAIIGEILTGLGAAARATDGDLAGIAVDSWAIDYGLIDRSGASLGEPFHHRDARGPAAVAGVHAVIPPERLYERTGVQFLGINTVYQLAAERSRPAFAAADRMLLIPDLIGHRLTGVTAAEATNASTTGLFDVATRDWATDLIEELGLPRPIFPPIAQPGEPLGPLLPEVAAATGLPRGVAVGHVGSHDTASAYVGVPAADDRAAFIACGTWALVGVEIGTPILTEASRAANFTNELGVDGRIRYLHNVMGLWLLQESLRAWGVGGDAASLEALLAEAAEVPAGGPTFDAADPAFLAPGDMPARIAERLTQADRPVPASRPAMVRCILDSLAAAFADAVEDASRLSGQVVEVIHVVGGGSRNALLCQLTADATGLPVVAGPVEATAIGNLLVQARAHGFIEGDLETLRALVRATSDLRRFEPRRGRPGR
jgi:rhamnulokinase